LQQPQSVHKVIHSAAPRGITGHGMASKNRVTVNLSDEEATQLSSLAKKAKVSKAWLGRRAICDLLDRARNDDQGTALPIVPAGKGKL